ncbi:MAG: hypothetical protein AB7P21_24940 [Lautropia sp.]
MKALTQRLKVVRGAVALAATLLLVGGVLGWLAWRNHHERLAVALERAALESRIRQETAAMRATEEDARRFARDYDHLVVAGVVGAWNKLGAVDRFEAALAPWRERAGRYTVSVRTDATGNGAATGDAVAADPAPAASGPSGTGAAMAMPAAGDAAPLHRSGTARISVELQPLHETDLLAALDAASRSPIGLADVERCEISRRTENGDASLAASCTLGWHFFEPLRPVGRDTAAASPPLAGAPAPESIGPLRSADGIRLERLFFDPSMRRRAAAPVAAAPGATATRTGAGPGPRKVQGYVRRSGGPDVVWVDDRPAILVDPGSLSERDAALRDDARLAPVPDGRIRASGQPPMR